MLLKLSQFVHQPRAPHLIALQRILRYVKTAPGQGLFFPSNNAPVLSSFCDSDWGSNPNDRRSISGFCMLLRSSLISWHSKKQSVVARSSAESEYRAMATDGCEILWLHALLKDLPVDIPLPIPLYSDSSAAISISSNPVYHARTKHIELDCHFVREKVQLGVLKPLYVPSKEQFGRSLYQVSWQVFPLVHSMQVGGF